MRAVLAARAILVHPAVSTARSSKRCKCRRTERCLTRRVILRGFSATGSAKIAALAILTAAAACFPAPAAAQQPGQKTFSSAAEASSALLTALQKDDQLALKSILGADANSILSSGDAVEDKNERDQFVQKYQQMHRLVMEPDGMTTLYVGAENWPTPIPLAHKGAAWYFDTAAGKREILYRRIGENELSVIQVCLELVDAQKEYYAQPHDGDSTKQYAQKFFSDANKHNGLYWMPGPRASRKSHRSAGGIRRRRRAIRNPTPAPQPFHGYYFKVLTGQGAKAPGGARSYIVDGKMTRGFAFLAYPAEYRSSGVKTFIVDQSGIVYEKDLGTRTAEIAKAMTQYDRDATWHKSD